MPERHVQTFRQFQRVVTREVGALQDDFLGRGRPYGASRLLWEMGDGPVEVASLRERLGLDAGYASRLLRLLEGEGLVEVRPSPDDARAKVASRTAAGAAEVATLDRLSDDAAEEVLGGFTDDELAEIDSAARTLTRALTKRHLSIETVDPESRDARWCVGQFFAEIDALFDTGYDPAKAVAVGAADLTPPHGAFLVARLHGQPVGCGGVKLPPGQPAFLKRMWVAPSARGLGVAGLMLDRLEALAVAAGTTAVTLDTNSRLTAAGQLYASRGYRQVPDFNGEPHADRWYRKEL
ncbi:bifunctional helix-turn-helix transcriptional regulator/GNAT family N-acetyltransferase [Demequina sp. TTPB684]|uniref:bifunctional helix-turn-helix transcriptional regulator/GNAT family N-acetyltransferase n=1 Tax=unclassified Demequina TaxID=2620311 RepID=UPI001CF20ED6|nr:MULTISPECIES: helix-turn-helix domain-containing GNAT family N-acetyltransferase [unclassified Demequina]MCB2412047.1 bifunctional helix-turn-helix transcriptional regulator/GNAT family N-acetyltransferase [Demequina sp. TTPB684]UPU88027.1 bifunctional helix-turn-helix transcriptional regulator/GNAT family N-acetyltransferase [Demequina sp. TMPB413]